MKPRVAIIGTGIAGMACAWYLRDRYSLTLYEKNQYIGGHTNTVMVKEGSKLLPIDTGFMVYNEVTYPNLVKFFKDLKIETRETSMSFGVQQRMNDLEYACSNLGTFFAQRTNLLKASHWSLLREVLRFFKSSNAYLESSKDTLITLKNFLRDHGFKSQFIDNYLLPMTSAIWSTPPARMLEYPAESLFRFMNNHRLLGVGIQLPWRTVVGGSKQYKEAIFKSLDADVKTDSEVAKVSRFGNRTTVLLDDGYSTEYENVIIATHADQAIQLLKKPSNEERKLLSCFQYSKNSVVLHSDESVMPCQKRAWASWNFRTEKRENGEVVSSTHYWMNNLQMLSQQKNYFVSVDYDGHLAPEKIHWKFCYDHPIFTTKAIEAQKGLPGLNDSGQIYFCGSYFRHGFHEDALVSALDVVEKISQRKRA